MKDAPELLRLLQDVRSALFSDNTALLIDEVASLQERNLTAKLKAKRLSPPLLTEAVLENNASRNRVSSIHMLATRKAFVLKERIDTVTDVLLDEHDRYLSRYYSTAKEKERAIRVMLQPAYTKLRQYREINEICEIALRDMDATGWALNRVIETVRLHERREKI